MNAIATMNPSELLQQTFGWSAFKAGQLRTIEALLRNESALAVFPTGGGKSLCYQLPAVAFSGLTIVVSPLIALMKDQIDQLESKGILAVRLDSSLTHDEYREAMDSIRGGRAKLLYVAPERFFNERFRNSLDDIDISLFAIDEAHCISQWGHNFRPDYLKLAGIARHLGVARVLALTATATPTVQDDICQAFDILPANVICTDFFRPNLRICSTLVDESRRVEVLIDKLKSRTPGATIVYVTQQKTAEQIASTCREAGLAAQAYHAGMKPETRNEIQEWFLAGDPSSIIVATIAFGMGIDKSDIRYIFHYNPPKSLENYAQEIGRAGRDEKRADCELLLVPQDRVVLENFVYGDTPSAASLELLINEIAQQPAEFFVSHYKLGNTCDLKPLVVKTLLTYLELDGYLEATKPRYDSYSFKPNVSSATILDHFSGERRQFASQLLACSKKGRTWFNIDLVETAERLSCERSRMIKALDYFAEQGWLELKVSGLMHGYRKRKSISAPLELAREYFQRGQQREGAEISRIDQVLQLAQGKQCQPAILSAHFGQPLDHECGICSYCAGDQSFELEFASPTPLTADTIQAIEQLVAEHPTVLNDSRSLARFLGGLTSPALTRAKLSRHTLFGCRQSVPFADLLRQLEKLPVMQSPDTRE